MKKKKIIIPVSIAVLLISLITINVEKANAGTGMCTYQAVFFYNEAFDVSHTGLGTTTNNTSWTDGTGTSANGSNVSFEVRDMTTADCVNYVNDLGYKSSPSYSSSDCVSEPDGSITCGNQHINNGSYETGSTVVPGLKDMITDLGGGDVTAGCEQFVNNTIKADNVDIKQNGVNPDTGKVQDEITRDYDYDTGTAMTNKDGQTYKYSAQTVIKTWTAPCQTDDKDPDKEKEKCSCSGGGGGGGGGSMTTCGGTHTNTIQQSACGSFTGTPKSMTCTASPTISWSVSVTTTEVITVSVSIVPQTIYAGGGVGVNISHNSSTSSSIGSVCVSTNEKVPECNKGDSLSGSTANGFECIHTYEEQEWDSVEEKYIWVTKTERYAATCVATSPNGADQARAESEARAAAAALGGGGKTPEPINIHARQSNDEKDKNMYNLSNSVAEQGVAVSTSNNGKVVSSGSMGTGNGMHTSINLACINRKTGKVRYVTSGSCTDDEVDGGNKYYIPLKDPDETFNFRITSGNISTMTTTTLDGMCGVTVKQKLYDKTTGKYKYIYRPVDLLTDPQTTVFPGRSPASNWIPLKNTENASRTGQYDLLMKRNKLEYSAKLDPAAIINIKNINDVNKNYASLDTISNNGRSILIDNLGVTRSSNTVYNKLGECNRKAVSSVNGVSSDNSDLIVDGTECW